MKKHKIQAQSQSKWSDLKSMASYPLLGEDAQEWVSQTRREADEHREGLLRNTIEDFGGE